MSSAVQTWPDVRGRFGPYGGRYVPETLMAPLEELEQAYAAARASPASSSDCCEALPGGPRRSSSPSG